MKSQNFLKASPLIQQVIITIIIQKIICNLFILKKNIDLPTKNVIDMKIIVVN